MVDEQPVQATTRTKPAKRSTRMWGVVTPRGRILCVTACRQDAIDEWHYEIEIERATVRRVVVTVEATDAR